MRPNYRGVKFYSANDLSIGWALEKAEKNIIEFEADERGNGGIKNGRIIIFQRYKYKDLQFGQSKHGLYVMDVRKTRKSHKRLA